MKPIQYINFVKIEHGDDYEFASVKFYDDTPNEYIESTEKLGGELGNGYYIFKSKSNTYTWINIKVLFTSKYYDGEVPNDIYHDLIKNVIRNNKLYNLSKIIHGKDISK